MLWTDDPVETPGLNHLILTISNVARSRIFYQEILGFHLMDIADGFYFVCGGVSIFFFPSNRSLPDDRFDESRIGLDHLSFTAPNEEALQTLADKLHASGIETQGVEQYHTGNKYVAFRDPDNIQLEYWLPK